MFLLRMLSDGARLISQPFYMISNFMRNNPATQSMRLLRNTGSRLNSLRSFPARIGKQLIPARFRKFTPKKGAKQGETDDKELPEEAAHERGGRKRRTGGRRGAVAQRTEFTQIQLLERGNPQPSVVHIGSTIGNHTNELILNDRTRKAIQLEFSQVDPAIYGVPTQITIVSGPTEATLTVDNVVAQPSAPIRDGSVVNIDGRIFDVSLFSGGVLPVTTRVDAAWETNVGTRRDDNQDAIGIYQHKKAYMFTVADGVGGGFAGDQISEFAVKYLLNVFKKNIDYERLSWFDVYNKAFAYINAEVRNFVEIAPGPAGTTLTSVFIRNWTMYVAHVGDSRIYLQRGRELRQLTTDHNLDTPIETRNKAGYPVTVVRNILQKAIGKQDSIDPDVFTIALQPNDRILLMTDGISSVINNDEIHQIATTNSLQRIPETLIEMANLRQNDDNASVIALDVLPIAYERDIWYADTEDRIYVGGPAWFLKLRKPMQMNTIYSFITQLGCFVAFVVIFFFSCFWSGYQIQRFFRGEIGLPQWAAIERNTSTPQPSLLNLFTDNANATPFSTAIVETDPLQQETPNTSLLSLLSNRLEGTPISRELVQSTPISSDSPVIQSPEVTSTAAFLPATVTEPAASIQPLATIEPSNTPFPTLRSATSTRIPPTSTLRPGES